MNYRLALLGVALGVALFVSAPTSVRAQPVRGGVRAGISLAQVRGGTFSGVQPGVAVSAFGRVRLSERFSIQPEVRYVRKGGGGAEDAIEDDFMLGTSAATGTARLRVQEARLDGSVRADFVEVPLLARYALSMGSSWNAGLYAGPYAGVRVGSGAEADVQGRFTLSTDAQGEVFDEIIDDSVENLVDRVNQLGVFLPGDAPLPRIDNPLAADDLFERFDYGLAFGGDVALPFAGERVLLGVRYDLGLRDLLNQDSDAVQSAQQLLDSIDDFADAGNLEGKSSTLTVEVGLLF